VGPKRSISVDLRYCPRRSHLVHARKPCAPADPSMAIDSRTIAELEAAGFTHVDALRQLRPYRADAVQVVADARADHQGNEDHRAAPSLPMPELREFTRGKFRPLATRRQHWGGVYYPDRIGR
jgi:hypothetical protein